MPALIVDLQISPEALKALYRGSAHTVSARATDGRRVSFPASCLRPFISEAGVVGRFRLEFDQHHKLITFQPVTAGV